MASLQPCSQSVAPLRVSVQRLWQLEEPWFGTHGWLPANLRSLSVRSVLEKFLWNFWDPVLLASCQGFFPTGVEIFKRQLSSIWWILWLQWDAASGTREPPPLCQPHRGALTETGTIWSKFYFLPNFKHWWVFRQLHTDSLEFDFMLKQSVLCEKRQGG